MTAQLIARIDDELLSGVDSLISLGLAANRSEVVRIALSELIERTKQAEIDRRLVAAYSARPQPESDIAHAAALRMIAAEPW